MRNLLWKDFWQNSKVLLAVGIVAAIPYVVVLGVTLGDTLADRSHPTTASFDARMWAGSMIGASGFSLGLCILMAAFIGGNAIAGERADRTAEFAAGLPIPRGQAVTSKALVAAIPCLAMWAINAAVWIAAWQLGVYANDPGFRRSGDEILALPFCLIGIMTLFGLGWLYSSLVRNPAIAAAAAIGTALGFLVAGGVGANTFFRKADHEFSFWVGFFIFAAILSALAFAVGTAICSRRVGAIEAGIREYGERKAPGIKSAAKMGLLWKDFRQNSRTLLGVGIIVAVPYAVTLAVTAWERLFWSSNLDPWTDAIMSASFGSMLLSVLFAAFIGGNAIAGERADRSAEFAAGLPIPRGPSVVSKAALASVSCLSLWAINAAVLGVAFWVRGPSRSSPFSHAENVVWTTSVCLVCSLLLFGLSWLYSSLLSSPAISAAAAIGTALGIFLVVQHLCGFTFARGMNDSFRTCLFVLPPIIAVLCLAAGATICLKRVEP